MEHADKSEEDGLRRTHFDKHVSTACDACRQKRRKCDGERPCLVCKSIGHPCSYSHVDRRRERPKQNVTDKVSGQHTRSQSSGDHEGYEPSLLKIVKSGTTPNGSTQAISLAPESEVLPKVAKTSTGGNHTHLSIRPRKSNDRSSRRSEYNIHSLKDLQGKFATKISRLGHDSHTDTGSHRASRILPKSATTSTRIRPAYQRQPCQFTWSLERRKLVMPGRVRNFGNLPFSSSIATNGYPAEVQARQIRTLSTPEYLSFPLLEVDESPLGRTYADFVQLGRHLVAQGTPPSHVADEGLIDVTLYFRDRLPEDPVNASTWASEMLRAFKGTFTDELLLACAVGVGNLMRWFLVPTAETYAKIPALARPTHLQRMKPHPGWVDLMVFPSFRNALINNLRDWVEPCMKAKWQILWPHSLEKALIHDIQSQRIYLTPEFATYVQDPKNWAMQREILDTFSEIEGSEINIVQGENEQNLP